MAGKVPETLTLPQPFIPAPPSPNRLTARPSTLAKLVHTLSIARVSHRRAERLPIDACIADALHSAFNCQLRDSRGDLQSGACATEAATCIGVLTRRPALATSIYCACVVRDPDEKSEL